MERHLAYVPPFQPQRSRLLIILMAVGHAGAMTGTFLSALAPWPTVGATCIVLLSWCVTWRRWCHGRWGGGGWIRICADGTWLHERDDGSARRYRPKPPHFVHPLLLVIRLRDLDTGCAPLDLVLPPDSLPPEAARRLRVWLRAMPEDAG